MKKEVKVKRNYTSCHEFGEFTLRYFSFSYKESNSWLLVNLLEEIQKKPYVRNVL